MLLTWRYVEISDSPTSEIIPPSERCLRVIPRDRPRRQVLRRHLPLDLPPLAGLRRALRDVGEHVLAPQLLVDLLVDLRQVSRRIYLVHRAAGLLGEPAQLETDVHPVDGELHADD